MMQKELQDSTHTTIMLNEERAVDNDNLGVSIVPDLPMSMISEILSRLSVEDVAKCKCVCKDWYHLSKDPYFTHLHFTRSSQQKKHSILIWEGAVWEGEDYDISNRSIQTASLITKRGEDEKWNTISNITVSPEAEATDEKWIEASCNGLICINNNDSTSEGPNLVYNPLTKDAITLPVMNFHPDYDKGGGFRCGFGFDSLNNKYTLVLAYKRRCYSGVPCFKMSGAIITLGESSWKSVQFPDELEEFILNKDSLFFDGAFHWAIGMRSPMGETHLHGILHMDITTQDFEVTEFSSPLVIPCSCYEQILVDNSLAFVRYTHFEPTTLEIWQIQGANPDDTCHYKNWTFSVHIEGCSFVDDLEGFKIQGVFGNGDFLFKVYQDAPMDEPLYFHLVLYDAKKNKGSVIEISGAPMSFNARNFLPSFISPSM